MRGKTQELPNTSRAVTRREANMRKETHKRCGISHKNSHDCNGDDERRDFKIEPKIQLYRERLTD